MEVKTRMPGSIFEITSAVGDKVSKNDPLLTMEAMKMEQIIASPVDGTVTEIKVAKGDRVDPGDVLVIIEE